MRGVNKVIIVGRLGNDPVTRQFANGGGVTNISVATSEQWTDKQTGERREATEWHRISFFGKLAEIAAQYLRKGSSVYVEGSLRTNKYTDQNGIERYSTEIRADNLQMLDSNPNNQNGGFNQNNGGFGGYPNNGFANNNQNFGNNSNYLNNANNNNNNRYPNNNQNFQNGYSNNNQPNNQFNQGFGNPSDNQGYQNNSFMQSSPNNPLNAQANNPTAQHSAPTAGATPSLPKTETPDDDIPF